MADEPRLPPPPSVAYGDHPDQVANLHLPAGGARPWPCVVLLHGGFWRTGWDRTLMTPLAVDLARRGLAAWNLEYRRVGQAGGGWPGTLADVAAGLDRLAEMDGVDATRIATCGHSAGGHLAVWLAARHRLPAGAIGADPVVRPVAAVAQAGVLDLHRGHEERLGGGAVEALLGVPDAHAERYATASPAALAPLGVDQLLVHGTADDVVPVTQSRIHAALDPRAVLAEVEGGDHFDVIDPGHEAWRDTVAWLSRRLEARS